MLSDRFFSQTCTMACHLTPDCQFAYLPVIGSSRQRICYFGNFATTAPVTAVSDKTKDHVWLIRGKKTKPMAGPKS